jgi:peptidoglycan/LPS O-acetylase OafA/YrhL
LAATLSLELSVSPYVSSHADTIFINSAPFLVLVVTTPFVFMLTRGNAFDSFLGNLAYPVYLVHILVFAVVDNTPIKGMITKMLGTEWLWIATNLMLVMLVSCVVEFVAIRPVDAIRVRFGARQRKAAEP